MIFGKDRSGIDDKKLYGAVHNKLQKVYAALHNECRWPPSWDPLPV